MNGHVYDVSNFRHPGDSILIDKLVSHHGRDVTQHFIERHISDGPSLILDKARQVAKLPEGDEKKQQMKLCQNIRYIGPAK